MAKPIGKEKRPQRLPDDPDDEAAWEALDEVEGAETSVPKKNSRQKWLPEGMDPVLEELPKWGLLGEVLKEIEEEILRQENSSNFTAREFKKKKKNSYL
jgi:DNA excision repair protein ERCC-4